MSASIVRRSKRGARTQARAAHEESEKSADKPSMKQESEDQPWPELKSSPVRYEVLELIGEGTFSKVYRAKYIEDGVEKFVALKRLTRGSSPQRVVNEIKWLHQLGGRNHVVELLDVMRYKDHITLVLPYFQHQMFKSYYYKMTVAQTQRYMKALFESLAHLHANNVIHRDVKPLNFLHAYGEEKYLLVDFGLAQLDSSCAESKDLSRTRSACSHSSAERLPMSPMSPVTLASESTHHSRASKRKKALLDSPSKNTRARSNMRGELMSRALDKNVLRKKGVRWTDGASSIFEPKRKKPKLPRVERGGTRGFRAPEVLLHQTEQTVSLDIWSAGVMLLCILCRKYPFFGASDDYHALCELFLLYPDDEFQDFCMSLPESVQVLAELPESNYANSRKNMTWKEFVGKFTKDGWPDEVFDLLSACLTLDFRKRISAQDALKHPFLIGCQAEPHEAQNKTP